MGADCGARAVDAILQGRLAAPYIGEPRRPARSLMADTPARTDFPLMQGYLASLPNHLASHPSCQSKASLLRSALSGHPTDTLRNLPSPLQRYIDAPPAPGLWIPAVHLIATVHALIDLHYPTEEAILAWGAQRTASLSANPLYRALLRVSGPRIFFTMTARVNRLFQRGTAFEILELAKGRVVASLRFPHNLHNRTSLLGTVAMCDSIVEQTGGTSRGTQMTEISATHARFECDWDLP